MRAQAIQNLIQISYSVPNGYNLRKACYQYINVNSRKAGFMDYISSVTSSLDKKEQAEVTADGFINLLDKVKHKSTETISLVVNKSSEATKFVVDNIKDPQYIGQKAEILFKQAVKDFDLVAYSKELGMDEEKTLYIQNAIKKELLHEYNSTKEHIMNFVPDEMKEKVWEYHVKYLWEKKLYLEYFKELYAHTFEKLGHMLELDPHTLQITTTVFVGMILAYIVYRNMSMVKKVAIGLLKMLAAPFVLIIKSIASVSKWFYNLIFGKAKKNTRRAALKEAIKTGNKKVIVLASYL
jgi:hypothetical protein